MALIPCSALAAPKYSVTGKLNLKGNQQLKRLMQESLENFEAEQQDGQDGDWNEAPWAVESIARGYARGIVRGYEDGLFRPNQPVKQVEALVMVVRALGLEEEALKIGREYQWMIPALSQNRNLKGKVPDDWLAYAGAIRPSLSWALGYILLAVDQDWVDPLELQPNTPATRAWAAMVLVRAMGLKEEALAAANAQLPFSDASAIPADKRGYVSVAVEHGLLAGYPDNTFKPQKPVTRAEMTTILDRLHESEGVEFGDLEYKGTILGLEGSKIRIQESGKTGSIKEFTVSADALVILDGKLSTLSAIKAPYEVRLYVNGSGTAVLLICKSREVNPVTPAPVESQVEGELTGISWDGNGWILSLKDSNGEVKTIRVSTAAVVKRGDTPISVTQLQLHERIRVRLREGVGFEVAVITSQEISGRLVAVVTTDNSVSLTIRLSDGSQYNYVLAAGASVTFGNQPLTVADLKPGDTVTLRLENGLVAGVRITARGAS